MNGEREFTLESSNETFMDILGALTGDGSDITNVNLPNEGQVEDLQSNAVVETNATIGENEIKSVAAGGFPRSVRSLI